MPHQLRVNREQAVHVQGSASFPYPNGQASGCDASDGLLCGIVIGIAPVSGYCLCPGYSSQRWVYILNGAGAEAFRALQHPVDTGRELSVLGFEFLDRRFSGTIASRYETG